MATGPFFWGVDGGGTRSTAVMTDRAGRVLERRSGGPANVRLLDDDALSERFQELCRGWPRPAAIAAGLAGVRTDADRRRVESVLARLWPEIPVRADADVEAALRGAAEADGRSDIAARVVVLSGTGACCFGRNERGAEARVGGWGHILGDRGSAYEAGLAGLREALADLDRRGAWNRLGPRLLGALTLNAPEDLIPWAQRAQKAEIAALAPAVFAAAAEGDPAARRVVARLEEALAADAEACARRLAGARNPVAFHLAGGLLLAQPGFARRLARRLKAGRPNARVSVGGPDDAARGAALMACGLMDAESFSAPGAGGHRPGAAAPAPPAPKATGPSPTEARNPRSTRLDQMPLDEALDLMLDDAGSVNAALKTAKEPLLKVVQAAARSLGRGGRIFYVGAGSSGRLGVLDASECPPTFRADRDQVQGIIAGGAPALTSAIEGAEDDRGAGAAALAARGIGRADLVVGLAASGSTPFVWGALQEARERGAVTALVHCNPALKFPRGLPRHVVTLDVGPEILTGSTRLKAGTATKTALNAISTLAFVGLGKVMSNLMIDLHPANEKLRARAARIVAELAGAPPASARTALETSGWSIRLAVERLAPGRFSRRVGRP